MATSMSEEMLSKERCAGQKRLSYSVPEESEQPQLQQNITWPEPDFLAGRSDLPDPRFDITSPSARESPSSARLQCHPNVRAELRSIRELIEGRDRGVVRGIYPVVVVREVSG